MQRDEPLLLLRVCTLPLALLATGDAAAHAARASLVRDEELRRTAARLSDALHAAAGPAHAGAPASVRHALLRLRRDVHNEREPVAGDLHVARMVDAPCTREALAAWERATAGAARARAAFVAAHDRAFDADWERLRAIVAQPRVAAAIRLAGRTLAGRLGALEHTEPACWTHRERHTALKALAYVARAASKTSPNGLFCAVAIAGWGESTTCAGHGAFARVDCALSVAEARKVAACLARDPLLEAAIAPRRNPTLRREAEHWTFWKPASARHATDDETRVRMRVHPLAEQFLELADGTRRVPELLAAAGGGLAPAAAHEFFRKLVTHGLLIAEIEIPYTERRPLAALAAGARRAGLTPPWLEAVEAVERDVDALAALEPAERGPALDALGARVGALPHVRPLIEDELVRVDAASEHRVTLARAHLAGARRFMDWYARLFGALYPAPLFVAPYARRFLERHSADGDVCALDLYHGAFEPTEQPRPWGFPRPAGDDETARAAAAAFDRVRDALARAALHAMAEGRDEVALDAFDWEALLGPAVPRPWACGLLFQVTREPREDAAAGARATVSDAPAPTRERRVVSAIYPGLGLALARFSHLLAGDDADPVADELRRGRAMLARHGTIVAEVTYMHGARTANAGLRPAIFDHEIELPGDACSPGAVPIRLADLLVRWDSAARRFVLRRADGVEVIPTLSSGIAPEGFVSFLLAIGRQDTQALSFFPGFACDGVRRWPRFTWEDTVVFRARREFAATEVPLAPGATPAARFLAVARWRRTHDLPRHAFVSSAAEPKPFFVDFDSPASVELFAHLAGPALAARDGVLHVAEMLPGPEQLWVGDETETRAAEFLVQLQGGGR